MRGLLAEAGRAGLYDKWRDETKEELRMENGEWRMG
jgi:hypothetical protein